MQFELTQDFESMKGQPENRKKSLGMNNPWKFTKSVCEELVSIEPACFLPEHASITSSIHSSFHFQIRLKFSTQSCMTGCTGAHLPLKDMSAIMPEQECIL